MTEIETVQVLHGGQFDPAQGMYRLQDGVWVPVWEVPDGGDDDLGATYHWGPGALEGYAAGDAVTEWSGSNGTFAAVPDGSVYPLAADGPEGHRVVSFALGSEELLQHDDVAYDSADQPFTVLIVARYAANDNDLSLISGGGPTPSFGIVPSSNGRWRVFAGTNLLLPSELSDTNWHVFHVRCDGVATRFGADTNVVTGDAGTYRMSSSSRLVIGGAFNDPLFGEVGEVAVWTSGRTDQEIDDDVATLMAKWGI